MIRIALIALVTLLSFAQNSWAIRMTTLEKRLIRSAESFQNVTESETGAIPLELLKRAQGIIIFRQYEAGFGIGGKGGMGVALARGRDGRWSAPAFLASGEGSFGFQIGVQRLDVVYLFMNRNAMKLFEQGKFRIGVDAAAAAGPVGANVEGKVGAPILVYSDNAGLYAGATIEGGVLIPDNSANETFYGIAGISVPEILYGGGVRVAPAAQSLISVLNNYQGANQYGRPYESTRPTPKKERSWSPPTRPGSR